MFSNAGEISPGISRNYTAAQMMFYGKGPAEVAEGKYRQAIETYLSAKELEMKETVSINQDYRDDP